MKKALFKKIVSILNLESGKSYDFLDIGCGKGHFLGCISEIVTPESNLCGIDAMKKAIDKAQKLYPNVNFHQDKFIDSFSFSDNSFDIIVCVDTLECIPNKALFLSEVARMLRPTGKILFAHWDWDTQVYNSKYKKSIRKFVTAFSDYQQGWMDACDGQMGRKLWGILEGSELFAGVINSFTLLETKFEKGQYGFDIFMDFAALAENGTIDETELKTVRTEMRDLSQRNRYFYSLNSYIYTGSKA